LLRHLREPLRKSQPPPSPSQHPQPQQEGQVDQSIEPNPIIVQYLKLIDANASPALWNNLGNYYRKLGMRCALLLHRPSTQLVLCL
jgi:hypothetical protein